MTSSMPFVFPNRAQRRAHAAMTNRKPKPKRKATFRANQKANARDMISGESKINALMNRAMQRTILVPKPTGRD